uniref:Senescence domain-containing protein n=1 Tax=Arion vulgaris TaxID=1028688 RepID=A0A0B6ZI36_9EUPU
MATTQLERHVPPPRPPLPQIPPALSAHASSHTVEESAHIWSFRDLQKVHDMAYRLVDAGLQADEQGDLHLAEISYTESLRLLDKALRVNCEKLSQCTTDHINDAKLMLQKVNKTKQQITFRLQTIQAQPTESSSQQVSLEPTAPPSYEQTMSEPPNMPPSYEDDELTALGESLMRRETNNSNLTNGVELFNINDGVQLFYITADGLVSAPTYPTSLHIVRLMDEPQTQGQGPPVFLHVGDWMYPLIPGTSPALHTNYGAYLFPDVTASQPGAAVGLIFPDTLSQEERQRFEDIIRSSTLYGEQSPSPCPLDERPTTSGAVIAKPGQKEIQEEEEALDTAGKISKAAEWIAWGVSKGAEKASLLIRQGSVKFQEHYSAADHVHKIDPKVQKGVFYAREATHGAVKVTGYIVNKLGALTVAVAKELAPHVKKQGMKILPQSMKSENSQGKSTVDGVVEVAGSGLKGFGTVYMSLETAAKTLGKCLANETVKVVTHKYGEEAGCLTENTMYTAGNVFMTAHNANNLGIKAIAKRAARETGKAVLVDLKDDKAEKDSSIKSASTSGGSSSKTNSSTNLTNKKQSPDSGSKI